MVGSDAKAQSDIYSAITLAGVIDTDCVILAGPRDGDMLASQRARLDAASAGGYIVGGTAAVPAAKTASRTMTRLAGADRWTTAQLVGSEARSLSGVGAPAAPTPDTSLTAPDGVQQPGVHLRGAEPWIASDCAGDISIVVGSDAKAQSDIYSAVTLAGVVGTDCVILAGPRDGNMPASQQARLDTADEGGFVVGGIAAVPTAKIAGRDMTRLAGTDRWATAQLVGRRASGDTTAGTSTAAESASHGDEPDSASAHFTAVSIGDAHSCAMRSDGTLACWGDNMYGQANAPSGTYKAIAAGHSHSCAIATDSTIICWGDNHYGQTDAPSSTYKTITSDGYSGCAIATDDTIACWGTGHPWSSTNSLVSDVPEGTFTTIEVSGAYACAIATDNTVTCWGLGADAPSGTFTAVSLEPGNNANLACGIRTDRSVICWGDATYYDSVRGEDLELGVPEGSYMAVAVVGPQSVCAIKTDRRLICRGGTGGTDSRAVVSPKGTFKTVVGDLHFACAVRTDDTAICWDLDGGDSRYESLRGAYKVITTGFRSACGIKVSGAITCAGYNSVGYADVPQGTYTTITHNDGNVCGISTDMTIACWGNGWPRQTETPSGTYTALAVAGTHACAIKTNGSLACWGDSQHGLTDAPTGRFTAIAHGTGVGGGYSCAIRTNGAVACWGTKDDLELASRSYDPWPFSTPPRGAYKAIADGALKMCGIRADDSLACWGSGYPFSDIPEGKFATVRAGRGGACAIATDNTVTCWSNDNLGQVPSGTYKDLSVGAAHVCAVRTDGTLACWGNLHKWADHRGQPAFARRYNRADPPSGTYKAVASAGDFACALSTNGAVACWGAHWNEQNNLSGGTYRAIEAISAGGVCAIRTDDNTVDCWSSLHRNLPEGVAWP